MQKDTCVWKMMYGGEVSKIFFRKWFVILRHLWWSKWTQKFFYCTISPGFDKIIIIKGGKHFRFIRLHSVFVPGRIDIDSMLGLSSCISVFGLTPLTRASVRYGGLHYFGTAFFFRCVPFLAAIFRNAETIGFVYCTFSEEMDKSCPSYLIQPELLKLGIPEEIIRTIVDGELFWFSC